METLAYVATLAGLIWPPPAWAQTIEEPPVEEIRKMSPAQLDQLNEDRWNTYLHYMCRGNPDFSKCPDPQDLPCDSVMDCVDMLEGVPRGR